MSVNNYPSTMDLAFESWILTNYNDQKAIFGTTYNIQDLTPINYQKLLIALYDTEVIDYIPLRELVYLGRSLSRANWNNYATNQQSSEMANAIINLYNYWYNKLALVPPFQCPMGVVTEMKTSWQEDTTTAGNFHLVFTFKVNWFVVQGSLYS